MNAAFTEAARTLARQHGISQDSAKATVAFRLASAEAPDEITAIMVASMLGCTEDESCIELGQFVLAESSLVYNRCDELGFDNFTDCASEQSRTSAFLLSSATWAVAEHVRELEQIEQLGGPAPTQPSVGGSDLGLGDCQSGPGLTEDEDYGACWEMGPPGDPSPMMYGQSEDVPMELQTVAPWMDPSNACFGLNPAYVGGQQALDPISWVAAYALGRALDPILDGLVEWRIEQELPPIMIINHADGSTELLVGQDAQDAANTGDIGSDEAPPRRDEGSRGTETDDDDASEDEAPARGGTDEESEGSSRNTSGGDAGMSSPHEGSNVATCAAQTEAMWDDCPASVVDGDWVGSDITTGTGLDEDSTSTTPGGVDPTCSFAQLCQSSVFSGLAQYAYLCGAYDPSPVDSVVLIEEGYSEDDCLEDGPGCGFDYSPVDIDESSQSDCSADSPDCGPGPWSSPYKPYSY